MELKDITKRNIERITGVPVSDLLEKAPKSDPRLKNLRRQSVPVNADLLVRGNPELTMGYVTTPEAIDMYWDRKIKERGDQGERRDSKEP